MKSSTAQKTKNIAIIGLFTALAFVVSVVLPIKVSFLTLDFKDAISTICGMFFGPVAGIVCAAIVPFIEFTYSDTGVYGLIMNLISSLTFVGISTLIYKYKKTLVGAVLGLATASIATVAVMLLANLFITPYYMGVTQDAVIELIPKLILPFNLIKTVLNSSITMLFYKPVSRVLKRMGITKRSSETEGENTNNAQNIGGYRSVIVAIASAAVLIIAFLVLFLVLGGKLA